MKENKRFSTLMRYFAGIKRGEDYIMVACMQFINIIVHSVEDMNFRVYLQYEFSSIGLDNYLDKLESNESEELAVQISAYRENQIEVQELFEHAGQKDDAMASNTKLEEELQRREEYVQDLEQLALEERLEMENKIEELKNENDQPKEISSQITYEYETLKRENEKLKQATEGRVSD
jgi:hypothetical protein